MLNGVGDDTMLANRAQEIPPGPILELHAVEKRFGDIRAVDGVSLEVRRGEILALVGPNGAGKTTLLRMIVGILGPDAGRITFRMDGGRPATVPDRARLGYLPEDRGLYTNVPVLRVLRYFAALRGMPRTEAVPAAETWLRRLDLAGRANDEVKALSKGNQQKVQFISAVLHRPALAILDEPFSGLDPLNQEFFLDLVRELRDAGTTILFSAHQMQLVERLADRVVLIGNGRVAGQGTLPELRENWGSEVSLHDIYVRTVGPVARKDRS